MQTYTHQHPFASHWWIHLRTNSVWTSGFVCSKLPETEEMRWQCFPFRAYCWSLHHSLLFIILFLAWILSSSNHILVSAGLIQHIYSSATLHLEQSHSNSSSLITPHEPMHYWSLAMGFKWIMFLKMLWHYHCRNQDNRNYQSFNKMILGSFFVLNNSVLNEGWNKKKILSTFRSANIDS